MYETVKSIPTHIFKDRMLRTPASKELHAYLQYMLDNYPDDLDYLHSASQEYINHNGGFIEQFNLWKEKLGRSLKRLEGTYE